jgi:uncharacterized membrane protein YesL
VAPRRRAILKEVVKMADQRRSSSGSPPQGNSIWDELINDPIMQSAEPPLPIKRGFFRTWLGVANDYLLSLIAVNLLVSLQVLVGVFVGLLLGAGFRASPLTWISVTILIAGVPGAPAFGGLFAYVRSAGDPDQRTTIRDYLHGIRRYARRSWVLFYLQLLLGFVLITNLRFYGTLHMGLIAVPLTALIALALLLWAMAGFYAWPLMVRDLDWKLVGRNALFLALAAPFSTVGLLLLVVVLSGLLIASSVLWLLFLFPLWALTENVALQRLVRVFRERQEARDGLDQTPDEVQ